MNDSEKLLLIAILLAVEVGFTAIVHILSGESLWRTAQMDRRGAIVIDIGASAALVLFLAAILPAFGHTGPSWRRPPFLVEFALYLPQIVPQALICGFGVSALRRCIRAIRYRSAAGRQN